MATIENSIQIVTVGEVGGATVEVHVRVGTTLVPTGITAPDVVTAGKLVADRLAGRA